MGVNSYAMRCGDLRNRVTFQTRLTAQDAAGQPIESWVAAFTCWADVAPLNGRELMAAQQVQSAVTHTITVRYRAEFADPVGMAKMRILFGTRAFNIHACMDQDSRRRTVMLQVEEGLNAG